MAQEAVTASLSQPTPLMDRGQSQLFPYPAAIRSFVEVIGSDIHFVAIHPENGDVVAQWLGKNIDAATAWALARNCESCNVYWTANIVRAGLNRKPKKTDIVGARFAHVDVDPPRDGSDWNASAKLDELRSLGANIAIFSGGGYQALWRLDEVTTEFEVIEEVNFSIMTKMNGDSAWNIDRLLRVPGTVNYPDATKLKRGRKPALAALLWW